jgi:YD repeat-containing protein
MMKRLLFSIFVILLPFLLVSDWAGAVEYTYDNLNRLIQVTYSPDMQIRYTYDQAGNMTAMAVGAAISVPGPPTITDIIARPGAAVIYFTVPYDGGSPITEFTATCTADGYETETASGPGSPLTVRDLIVGVAYECSVTATNSVGTSYASASVSVTVASDYFFPWPMFLPAIINNAQK